MKLNELPKLTQKKAKRLGRGYGSGVGGHTSSRGQKGQKARSNLKIYFEGGQLPFIRRFPFQRGKGRFNSLKADLIALNVSVLETLPKNETVTLQTLVENGFITEREAIQKRVKILGTGTLTTPLKVKLPVTRRAQEKIEAAGGEVVL